MTDFDCTLTFVSQNFATLLLELLGTKFSLSFLLAQKWFILRLDVRYVCARLSPSESLFPVYVYASHCAFCASGGNAQNRFEIQISLRACPQRCDAVKYTDEICLFGTGLDLFISKTSSHARWSTSFFLASREPSKREREIFLIHLRQQRRRYRITTQRWMREGRQPARCLWRAGSITLQTAGALSFSMWAQAVLLELEFKVDKKALR